MEQTKYKYECYQEIKRCFFCNDWIEGRIERRVIFNKPYYYHTSCYNKIKRLHLRDIETSLILLTKTPH